MKIIYEIIGKYSTASWEVLDEASSGKEALKLADEYRIRFGSEWIIKIRKTK